MVCQPVPEFQGIKSRITIPGRGAPVGRDSSRNDAVFSRTSAPQTDYVGEGKINSAITTASPLRCSLVFWFIAGRGMNIGFSLLAFLTVWVLGVLATVELLPAKLRAILRVQHIQDHMNEL